ncbi:hypothetical protein LCGC14_1552310 [marine sediment metagenome]|uniref:Uncharacterized protein n=1 Tax=marine sediment metagenome TaxID=412755 RepID=A0A0F9IQ09_9ZZZZ
MNHKMRGKKALEDALPSAITKMLMLMASENEIVAYNASKLIIEKVLGKAAQPIIDEGGAGDMKEIAKVLAQALHAVLVPNSIGEIIDVPVKELSNGRD